MRTIFLFHQLKPSATNVDVNYAYISFKSSEHNDEHTIKTISYPRKVNILIEVTTSVSLNPCICACSQA